ncbi:lipopolysaccharide biosynthesis protein [Arsenicicoccus sp. oral taxon 190]|uniref:lipopolysaccharide biosynthesis protein n=1 Tax=Arsenicicoccus sp. oral taxon 190 TaxID=1658671 RepID=UPI00067A06E7|nr:polysaccharide biosynthesis C-terminal domain-containing protein [Arsenicicoccus sp. oral taxon 190]AKT52364.1 hypothetical protein ADJ73_15735 [Arsenicicoccus sp. oral taxon 190]
MVEGDTVGGGMLKTLLKGTTWQALGQFLPLIINLALTPYIIEGLGAKIYGIFLLINTIQLVMSSFDGGIGPSASRYFTLYAGRADAAATTRLLVTLLTIVLGTTTVVFGLFFLATPAIIEFFPVTQPDPEGAALLLRTMVVLVAMAQIRGLFAYVLFAEHKFAVTTTTGLAGHLIYVIGLIWTIEGGHGLTGIALTFVVQQLMATIAIIPAALQHLSRAGVGLLTWADLKDFFGYSWKVQFSSLLDMVSLQGDMLIVSKFAAGQQPQFGPGANFAQQLRMVPMNAFSPVQAMLGRAVGGKGEAAAVAEYVRIQKLWVLGVVGWVAVGAPAAYFGVSHWVRMGSSLPGLVSAVLLVGHLFYLIGIIQVLWCLAVGRSDLELKYGLISTGLNLTLTLLLVIPYGVVGTIVATVFAQIVGCMALTMMMRHSLACRVPSPWRHIPYEVALLAASISYLCVYGAQLLVGTTVPAGPIALLLCGFAATPAAFLYAVLVVGPAELRSLVGRLLSGRIRVGR